MCMEASRASVTLTAAPGLASIPASTNSLCLYSLLVRLLQWELGMLIEKLEIQFSVWKLKASYISLTTDFEFFIVVVILVKEIT